jgi:molybdate transport system substrate-binding protein
MNTLWGGLIGATGLIIVLVFMLRQGPPRTEPGKKSLTVYCAAGMRIPVDEIAKDYEQKYNISVELQYGGSNTLLNQLQVNKFSHADLFLAADDFYTDKAVKDGLAVETLPIAHQRPLLAVRKDSVKQINSLEDLLQPGISVAVADPEQAAIGKAVRKLLEKIAIDGTNRWKQLEARVTADGVFKPTVNDVANDVVIGAVDAALVWDSTLSIPKYSETLKAVVIPELESDPDLISIAVLKSSLDPTAALRFSRFLTARDQGLRTFEKFGTRPVEGDVWAERPEVSFFCGAVNRRAIEKVIDKFQEREGVVVNTEYNGCGTLTSQMKAVANQATELGFPDFYMACDRYYLDNVKEWFQEDVDVSDVEMVIAVPKGSTTVSVLADLVKPGVRVAIGQPDQCTIGALSRRMLESEDLYEKLKEKQKADGEIVVEKMSSALLVPDVIAGHVDAALVYISDVLPNIDDVDIVRITTTSNLAVQPFSIARTSDHKYLARRLFRRIAASSEAFESAGFNFRLDTPRKTSPEGGSL